MFLGNIISDCPELRDFVINSNIVARLLLLINHTIPVRFMRNVIRIIVILCRKQNQPLTHNIVNELLLVLNHLIHNEDTMVIICLVKCYTISTSEGNTMNHTLMVNKN